MTNMKTKAEIKAWAKKARPHMPNTVTRAFINAGLCSDVPPPEEETRLFNFPDATKALDWNEPLVARHPDGRAVYVTAERSQGAWRVTPTIDGCRYFNQDGTHPATDWTIHNREPEPTYPEDTWTPEQQAEALEIIRDAAAGNLVKWWSKNFLAKLAPPVDPIIKEAREACAAVRVGSEAEYGSGKWDNTTTMQAVVYALRQRDT